MGFSVINTAANGKEALEYIENGEIDVVLCDIKMPVIDGIELAAIIYNQKIKTKIIFLSAYQDFNYAKKALKYGVQDYIIKPTRYQELVGVFKDVKDKLDEKCNLKICEQKGMFGCRYRLGRSDLSEESFNNKIILKVKKLVRDNYQHVSRKEIAEKVHLSPSYLSKFFRDMTGENFSEYVIKVKMEEAKRLLMDIDYCVYEVSEMIGYSNPKNFTRAFKRYSGKTPSEYRKGAN